ncbi:hypothetical protein ACLB2K_060559 [Fragaria x ananassa]
MVGPSRPQFVLFGSSIVQYSFSNGGWGAILADLYSRKADILVRGYAGWNSRRAVQVLEQVFPKVLTDQDSGSGTSYHDTTIQPSLVIVYFGGNDSMRPNPLGLGPHVPLPEYIENMRKIATHLQSLSEKTRIIFLSAPPVNEEQMREQLREMDIKAVDLCTSIQKRKDWETTCFTDGIHFSSEGSKIVAEEILKVLKEADWEPSLQWNSLATEFGEDSPYDLVGTDGKTMNVSDDGVARLMQWGISNGN